MLRAKVLVGGLLMSVASVSMAHADCGSNDLHEDMENLKTEMKSLSFNIKRGDYEQAEERVDAVLEILSDARDETPYLFEEKGLEGQELEHRQADYQSVIDDTIAAFESLDEALEAEDDTQVKALLKEVGDLRKKGHRAFKADC
ncbi:cytochrome b562 [Marinomonas ostreistagni]|uniref:cytochrome b562 n=1 Tax=Marinomonas ostreistagni TaxID=359209 RepID=UPI001950ED3B|nr:cytochrome b562 [Marinomonas ostreistagni]MBM6550282.1 hypothetical protein [Marinomonas ostreistagni]